MDYRQIIKKENIYYTPTKIISRTQFTAQGIHSFIIFLLKLLSSQNCSIGLLLAIIIIPFYRPVQDFAIKNTIAKLFV